MNLNLCVVVFSAGDPGRQDEPEAQHESDDGSAASRHDLQEDAEHAH